MMKAINTALKREGKRLCPNCHTVQGLENRECEDCGVDLPRVSTPEDGLV